MSLLSRVLLFLRTTLSIQHNNKEFALWVDESIHLFPSLAEALASAEKWKQLPAEASGVRRRYFAAAEKSPWEAVTEAAMSRHLPVGLLDGPIVTAEGDFSYSEIDPHIAELIANTSFCESFIGHAATAAAFSVILGRDVPACAESPRPEFKQKP